MSNIMIGLVILSGIAFVSAVIGTLFSVKVLSIAPDALSIACAKRSGKTSESAVPVIFKKGKAALRYAVYQAEFIASIRNIFIVQRIHT